MRFAWLALLLLPGCYESHVGDARSRDDAGPILRRDAGIPTPAIDAGPWEHPFPDTCDFFVPGRNLGSACRTGDVCIDPFQCVTQIAATVPSVNADGTEGPPFDATIAPGTECTVLCDLGAPNPCGDCGACSQLRLGAIDFAYDVGPSGSPVGLCRPYCTFDLASNGGCRPGYTCSDQGTCVESCQNDLQCRFASEDLNGDGVPEVVYLGDLAPVMCNTTTGRCVGP